MFPEADVFRIDHYLGKETVQNVLAFRFGNGIFEPLWNRRYVNHVQITAAESIGVEGRGAYYQEAGALRDMIQNHLAQVMATIAMEPPAVFDPETVRDERAKLLRSVRIPKPEEVPLYQRRGPVCRVSRRSRASSRTPQTDTYSAVTFHDRQLALGRRAVLHPQRQEAAQARHRYRHPVQRRAAFAIRERRFGRLAGRRTRTCWSCASSRKRASRCAFSPSIPAPACCCGR